MPPIDRPRAFCYATCLESDNLAPSETRAKTAAIGSQLCRMMHLGDPVFFAFQALLRLGVLLAPLGHESEDNTVVWGAQIATSVDFSGKDV